MFVLTLTHVSDSNTPVLMSYSPKRPEETKKGFSVLLHEERIQDFIRSYQKEQVFAEEKHLSMPNSEQDCINTLQNSITLF